MKRNQFSRYKTRMRMKGDDDGGKWNESAMSSRSHDMQNYTHSLLSSPFKILCSFVRVKHREKCTVAP